MQAIAASLKRAAPFFGKAKPLMAEKSKRFLNKLQTEHEKQLTKKGKSYRII